MSALPIKEMNNIIELKIINGELNRKDKVRYNKDGTIDKRHSNRIKGVSSEVYPFTVEEIKKMIEVFNNHIENATNENQRQIAWRNKTLFVVGVNVGLRSSDLLPIKASYFLNEDMSFKKSYKLQPKKTRKTGKFVEIYFNQTVKKIVSKYIKEYPLDNLDEYLFKSRKGNSYITERSLWKIIVDTAKEANISKNVGSHSLRKTWARQIYDNAQDKSAILVMLQECLRHSDSLTTLRYISIMDEEKKDTYESVEIGLDFI